MIRKFKLKNDLPEAEYTGICNEFARHEKLVACGPPDDKWMITDFEDGIDFFAFCIAKGYMGIITKNSVK